MLPILLGTHSGISTFSHQAQNQNHLYADATQVNPTPCYSLFPRPGSTPASQQRKRIHSKHNKINSTLPPPSAVFIYALISSLFSLMSCI